MVRITMLLLFVIVIPWFARLYEEIIQGIVVQSIVSITSSLRDQFVKCFMTL